MTTDREKWDAKYASCPPPRMLVPDDWLIDQVAELAPGRVLELACGLGRNAVWLAQQGWQVDAVDVSPIGLAIAVQLARRANTHVNWIAADLDDFTPAEAAYDLVVIFRFLDRVRVPALVDRALRAGGLLIYETFSRGQLARSDNHLKNPDFTVIEGELLQLFPRLQPLHHADDVVLADRTVARLVAWR